MFTAGARKPVIDQVHGGREANTETLKATQAYQSPKLTMTTTYNKTALFSPVLSELQHSQKIHHSILFRMAI